MVNRSLRPCIVCGALTVRMKRCDRRWICIDCAVDTVSDVAHSMHERNGVFYERYVASMVRRKEG